MRHKRLYIVIVTFFILMTQQISTIPASVIVPVADLLGTPLKDDEILPIEGKGPNNCARLHQLLFNEQVEIVEKIGDWVQIAITNAFYVSKKESARMNSNTKKHHHYWTHKENVMPRQLIQQKIGTAPTLPTPIDFEQPHSVDYESETITLSQPWHDTKTKKIYSAGTRFVTTKKTSKNHSTVALFDPDKNRRVTSKIPKELCINLPLNMSKKDRIQKFVSIARSWAQLPSGFIPYVWGGCSFTTPCLQKGFQILPLSPWLGSSYVHQEHFDYTPFPGLDCAGLITRAAQLCGIPYFFKNSYTAATLLRPLAKNEAIEEGDILWIPGHVMIVADIRANTLIEARSYYHGYGRVQEIKLEEEFKGIKTYEQLKKALDTNQVLERLTVHGIIEQRISNFKVLKLQDFRNNVKDLN